MTAWVNIGRPGPYGNRFVIGRDGDRASVVEQDRVWIWLPAQADLRRKIMLELHDKRLWCPGCRGSLPCHRTVREEIAAMCCDQNGEPSHEWNCRLNLEQPRGARPMEDA